MMIGEIDYGSIIVEAKEQNNEETGAPLAPIPEFSAVIICLFCVMVSVILMNLLVSVRYQFLFHGIENIANQRSGKPLVIILCCVNSVDHCSFYGMVYNSYATFSRGMS